MPRPARSLRTGRQPGRLVPTRVLVADDDDEMRALLAQTLRDDGYEVVESDNGARALLALSLDRNGEGPRGVDLVVTDLRMPGATGLEILVGLRALDWPVPVVLITAFLDEEVEAAARRLGVAAVLSKPFSLTELREAVHRAAPPRLSFSLAR